MFTFAPKKSALAAAALAAALACGSASPAAAFSFFGFNAPENSSSRAPAAFTPRPFDGGGNVLDYYGRAQAANSSSQRTVIAGVCASACTMKLGIRNACVAPDATLLFHQASYNGFRSELGTRVMLYAYPRAIRHWVLRNGALNSDALTELSGRQAISMGVRAC
jgi:hypothetical protein